MLLTTKGVFRFDSETKELYLAQIHPGVPVEEIKKEIPWNLKVAEELTETERPTDEEIDFVRKFAPKMTMGREVATELTVGNVFKKMELRKQRGPVS